MFGNVLSGNEQGSIAQILFLTPKQIQFNHKKA
jgi:hypothetical protein